MSKNAKNTTTELEKANREIARLRRVSSRARADHVSAMESLTWALGVARALVIGHARDAAELAKKQDAAIFADYNDAAKEAFARAGILPKFWKLSLRELKEYVGTLDDAEVRRPRELFERWAKKFVKENPELARARKVRAR